MNNLITPFHFQDFDIRVWDEDGVIFAVGRDIAAALGYDEPHKAIQRHCKGGMKRPIPTAGGTQEMLVITEGDIFTLIMIGRFEPAQTGDGGVKIQQFHQ